VQRQHFVQFAHDTVAATAPHRRRAILTAHAMIISVFQCTNSPIFVAGFLRRLDNVSFHGTASVATGPPFPAIGQF
jgi:hypothetical protein